MATVRTSEPIGGAAELAALNRRMLALMPGEFSGAADLMVQPLASVAAWSALSLGMTSHAFGLWMGLMASAAEASQKLLSPLGEGMGSGRASLPTRVAERPRRPASKAAVEELKEAALAAAAPAALAPDARAETAELLPEDFRQPRRIARPLEPDDLKKINGIGPKLEKVLNGLGVWTYAQIAQWSREEVAWVDDSLGFKGRIGRDDWIAQARSAAKLSGGKDAPRGA